MEKGREYYLNGVCKYDGNGEGTIYGKDWVIYSRSWKNDQPFQTLKWKNIDNEVIVEAKHTNPTKKAENPD